MYITAKSQLLPVREDSMSFHPNTVCPGKFRTIQRHFLLILALIIAIGTIPTASIQAQTAERCFSETGFCISGRIREFWEQNGGLPVFGYPIAAQETIQAEGREIQAQRFERNRLELHPELARPYDVLLGRLGVDRLAQQNRDWFSFPKSDPQPGCRYFAETGHNVCEPMLATWRANGLELDSRRGKNETENLALFGLPLSDLITENMPDGKSYQVQWFERARFEIHPENPPEFRVLLGLLGNEMRDAANAPPPGPPAGCETIPSSGESAVSPTCLRGGDKVSIVARGLESGSNISLQLNAPDGKEYEFAIIYGDPAVRADGSYVITGALQPGVPSGVYTLVIRSDKRRVASIHFAITPGAPSGKDESAIPPPVGGPTAYASPQMARRGEAYFTFVTDGALPANEEVGIYATHSDGVVNGAPFRVKTNNKGGVPGNLRLYTEDSDPYGLFSTTFEVIATGQKVIVYFRVVP
jgi:hypothetical protein